MQQESENEENSLYQERLKKIEQIELNTKKSSYVNGFKAENKSIEIKNKYQNLSKEELKQKEISLSVSGRILAKRGPFFALNDNQGKIQIYLSKEMQKQIKNEIVGFDLGDIVYVQGFLDKSLKGELYINVKEYKLLTKALLPLPEKFHGLADTEICYRQRYLDLIANEQTKNRFLMRSKIISLIRSFMIKNEFIEVETPMMHPLVGGAAAKPFITHHNSLDMKLYLRIAPELYLKRLIIGGFEKVFEINRNFRNEGLSTRHNPEFTMMEFYQAFATYEDFIPFTQDLFLYIAKSLFGTSKVKYQDYEFDFAKPFVQITMIDAILKYNKDITKSDLESLEKTTEIAKNLNIKIQKHFGLGKIINEIFEQTVEEHLIEPTFISQYPYEVSPLSRRNDENPFITDRFELFIGAREIANAFSELNDPRDQKSRFLEQLKAKDAGDDETMAYDKDYITALEHGLAPTAGQGIGIDRLVMLFTDATSIKDVILFPSLKEK